MRKRIAHCAPSTSADAGSPKQTGQAAARTGNTRKRMLTVARILRSMPSPTLEGFQILELPQKAGRVDDESSTDAETDEPGEDVDHLHREGVGEQEPQTESCKEGHRDTDEKDVK